MVFFVDVVGVSGGFGGGGHSVLVVPNNTAATAVLVMVFFVDVVGVSVSFGGGGHSVPVVPDREQVGARVLRSANYI